MDKSKSRDQLLIGTISLLTLIVLITIGPITLTYYSIIMIWTSLLLFETLLNIFFFNSKNLDYTVTSTQTPNDHMRINGESQKGELLSFFINLLLYILTMIAFANQTGGILSVETTLESVPLYLLGILIGGVISLIIFHNYQIKVY